ncbi:unnamed protein product [Darwinula stevensoni]|uniref:Large ribosomal subunit protein uL2 RNA-binding domain-containing protein n=1 Tax=Darwinula stevensoni TaxID=69355 RepID=A0A7R9FUA2_9CRUS|nr:unnamed protein product [Darwinula stevensoni]CAG0907437.1 unnamed protein product [Darwinula stevensoni]
MSMALMKVKPTSAGRRGMVKVVNPDLHKGKPFKALLEPQISTAGRNNNGHITTRHKGGGHKQHYRIIDFRRNDKDGILHGIRYEPYGSHPNANEPEHKFLHAQAIVPNRLQSEQSERPYLATTQRSESLTPLEYYESANNFRLLQEPQHHSLPFVLQPYLLVQ